MQVDFSPINDALRACRAAGVEPRIWWRDDDAIEPTQALDRLIALAEDTGCPVHLAVVPKHAQDTLASHIANAPAVPLVHGWAHENHSPKGMKKAEFGQNRTGAKTELESALARMSELFSGLLPVFVPPWNRVSTDLVPLLAAMGYVGMSTFQDRKTRYAAKGLVQVNTHIDPIFWRDTRDLVPPDRLVSLTAERLRARAEGLADSSEPLGLLTHHLVHTEAVWTFSKMWLCELLDGGATVQKDLLEL